mgnify:CR=1 FL=1
MSVSAQSEALLKAAEAYVPKLQARSDEIEKNRRLPQDIADSFAETGFYSMMVPERYQGIEIDPPSFLKIVRTLARGDASAAWCVMIGATTGLGSAYMPEADAVEIFGNGKRTITAGVFAPTGKALPEAEGYRISGRWQWGSGSPNAAWVSGGCFVMNDGKPEMSPTGVPISRMMMVPKEDVTLLDTWDVSGLCGTGSTDFEITDVFVPKGRAVAFGYDKPMERPLYLFPIFALLASGVASVALGTARAAIDELVGFASAKTPQGTLKPLANRPDTQMNVARAEALLRSAETWMDATVAAAWDAAQTSGEIDVALRRDMRLSMAHATTSAAEAVDLVYGLGGGTSVYRKSPLQRHFRDVHVATQHMMVAKGVLEQAGRLFLGLKTDTTLF